MSKDERPTNRCNLATVGRVSYFLFGLLTMINGLIFIGDGLKIDACDTQNQDCVGPALVWNTNNFIGPKDSAQNGRWRQVFSLGLNQLFFNWTGVFLGLITTLIHFPGFKYSFCTRTWLHVVVWSVFVICFGALPYAGNLGVLIGLAGVIVPVLALIIGLSPNHNEPTTLYLEVAHIHCGCLVDNEGFISFARVCSFIGGLAVLLVGVVHIINSNFKFCPQGGVDADCVGPSLFWNPSDEFLRITNLVNWGTKFTFAPDIFLVLWGPIILGVITILQHINGHLWSSIFLSWPRVFLWFMFLGLFGSMGYSGDLGIVVGFFCIFVAFMALLISFGGAATTRTHLEFHVKYLDRHGMMALGSTIEDTNEDDVDDRNVPSLGSNKNKGDDEIRANFEAV